MGSTSVYGHTWLAYRVNGFRPSRLLAGLLMVRPRAVTMVRRHSLRQSKRPPYATSPTPTTDLDVPEHPGVIADLQGLAVDCVGENVNACDELHSTSQTVQGATAYTELAETCGDRVKAREPEGPNCDELWGDNIVDGDASTPPAGGTDFDIVAADCANNLQSCDDLRKLTLELDALDAYVLYAYNMWTKD